MCLAATIAFERTIKFDYGLKAVCPSCFCRKLCRAVTANGQYAFQFATPCTNNIIVHVPTFYTQCFFGIKCIMRVGCLEPCQVKQTFIHNSNNITHAFAVLFRYGNGCIGFGPYYIIHFYYRVKDGVLVFHFNGHNAIHSYGQVVNGLCMWLYQAYIHINIGRHFLLYFKAEFGFALRCVYPICFQYFTSGFQTDQCTPILTSGYGQLYFFAHIVFRFVCLKR